MSEWISIEEAAKKYGIEKRVYPTLGGYAGNHVIFQGLQNRRKRSESPWIPED